MPIKTLPIGTVVQLVDVKEKVMICGRQQINEEDGLTYDYSGCPFPSGFDGENIFLFQSKSIVMVYHMGYQDLDELHQKFVIAEIVKDKDTNEL